MSDARPWIMVSPEQHITCPFDHVSRTSPFLNLDFFLLRLLSTLQPRQPLSMMIRVEPWSRPRESEVPSMTSLPDAMSTSVTDDTIGRQPAV